MSFEINKVFELYLKESYFFLFIKKPLNEFKFLYNMNKSALHKLSNIMLQTLIHSIFKLTKEIKSIMK